MGESIERDRLFRFLLCTLTASAGVALFGCSPKIMGSEELLRIYATPAAPASVSHASHYASMTHSPPVSWSAAQDADAGIDRYEYCVGTSTGACNTLVWTSNGSATSVNIGGLSLLSGTTYYVSVRTINKAGISSSITTSSGWLAHGSAIKLAFATQPSSNAVAGTAFAQQPVVVIQDVAGTTIPDGTDSVALSSYLDPDCLISASANLDGSTTQLAIVGLSIFSNISYTKSEPLYLKASSGSLTSACSSAISVAPAAATTLTFTVQPSSTAVAGTPFAQQPQVTATDAYGNIVTNVNHPITLNSYDSTCGIEWANANLLATTNPVNTSSGIATFSGVGHKTAGTGALRATASGLPPACSSSFTIQPEAAEKLGFTIQPGTAVAAALLSVQPQVAIQDAYGNTVSSASATITLEPFDGGGCYTPGTGTFTITQNPVDTSSGTAIFFGISYTKSVYLSLRASAPGLTSACSTSAYISSGAAVQLVFKGASGATLGQCSGPFTVQHSDVYGNASGTGSSGKPILLSGGGAGTFYSDSECTTPTTNISIANYYHSVSFYFLDNTAETVSMTATDNSGTPVTPVTQNITVSGISTVALGTQHGCAIRDGTLSCWGGRQTGQTGMGSTDPMPTDYSPRQIPNFSSVTNVSTGKLHTCAISNNNIYCWGNNSYGQLGIGSGSNTYTPALVSGMTGATAIAAGDLHACAILAGSVYCWGQNYTNAPANVAGLSSVTAIAAGLSQTCVVDGGAAKCWGENSYGQLGRGTTGSYTSTIDVVQGLTTGVTSVAVALGGQHACAMTSVGDVYCWGRNSFGQLGNNDTTDSSVPVQVQGLPGGASAIAVAGHHSCALSGSAVYCWGANADGELGDGTTAHRLIATLVPDLATNVTGIAAGTRSTCAIQSGQLKCVGSNDMSQLAKASEYPPISTVPVAVSTLSNVTASALGPDLSCFVSNNAAYCAGQGSTDNGQFSHPFNTAYTPGAMPALSANVSMISATSKAGCAIISGGVYCWGDNNQGAVGDGTTINRSSPTPVLGLSSGATKISLGKTYPSACAIVNGGLYCWGYGDAGKLGDGTMWTWRSTPYEVWPPGSNVTDVAVGTSHVCAIKSGNAYCWGTNSHGQLGDGTNTSRTTPTAVVGMPAAPVSIAVGSHHSCVVLIDGTAACWGYNSGGRLGTGSSGLIYTPTLVVGISGATKIAANIAICAIASGALYCWGENIYGTLGDGTLTNHYTATQVPGLGSGVEDISMANYSACAIVSGTPYCWGLNHYGQLGSLDSPGSIPYRTSPVSAGPWK